MGVSSLHLDHTLWSNKTNANTIISSVKKAVPPASEAFADTLQRMIGNGITPGSSSSSNEGGSEDDKVVTTTKVLDDGSLMVTITQGKKIISQTKYGGSHKEDDEQVKLGLSNSSSEVVTASNGGSQEKSPAENSREAQDNLLGTNAGLLANGTFFNTDN